MVASTRGVRGTRDGRGDCPGNALNMAETSKHRGLLIVLVGPSGVGKSTISRRLAEQLSVWYTVSDTTRPQKPGDENGKTYGHIDKKEFFRRLDSNQYLEYAQVYGDY